MKKLLVLLVVLFLSLPLFSATWYVRPAGGSYGAEDGTSYADAWDGLSSVVFGGGGVAAGDTLYVCGVHLRTYDSHPPGSLTWYIGSGTSGNPVTIRGDYGGDPGVIWGAAIYDVNSWVSEGSNTYSQILTKSVYADWVFEDITDFETWTVLDKEASLGACQANAGSYYSATYGSGTKLYVHCSDDGDPTGRIAVNRMGWNINLDGESYVNWLNIKTYCIYRWLEYAAPPGHSVNYITWTSCTMWYGEFAIIFFRNNSTFFTFDNCDIRWARNGICVSPWAPGSTHDWTIKNCLIRDIGVRSGDSDAHAVGVQSTYNAVVESNEMVNCGTTICFYLSGGEEVKDNVIRWNYVHDAHELGGANGNGIAMTLGGNQTLNSGTGNKIYGNIVARCVSGIRSQYHDEVEIYNNVVIDSDVDNYLINRYDFRVKAKLRNNVSYFSSWAADQHHIYYRTGDRANSYIDSDYNCFYPVDSNDCFRYDDEFASSVEYTFAEWQALSYPNHVFDLNSITSDPAFVNAGGSFLLDTDFQIPTDSPCKDAGTTSIASFDYWGTGIPEGANPDIGVHEFGQADPNVLVLKNATTLVLKGAATLVIKEP